MSDATYIIYIIGLKHAIPALVTRGAIQYTWQSLEDVFSCGDSSGGLRKFVVSATESALESQKIFLF